MSPVGSLEEVEHGAPRTRNRKLKECNARTAGSGAVAGRWGLPRPLIDSDGFSLQSARQAGTKLIYFDKEGIV